MSTAHELEVLPKAMQCLLSTLSVELSLSSNISTLRLVDEALSNLLHATVRARLNHCVAVNRLPPEVLLAIFHLLRAGSLNYGYIVGRHPAVLRPDNRSLIAVTHVCRRWRDVSLGCAQLWTNVSTTCTLAPQFFQRSQEMPLTVFVSLVRGRPPTVPKQLFLDQLPRIKVLHIDLECSAQIRHWKKHLQSLAKSLESLTVVTHGRESHLRANTLLIEPFFGTECPISLRFLSLSGTIVLIPADRFPALEHAYLSISSFSSAPFDHFEAPLPWILLANAPRLRTFHLHLQPAALRSSLRDHPVLPQVGLPMMQHLYITLPRIPPWYGGQGVHVAAVHAMLANLDLPRTAVLSVEETCTYRLPQLYVPYAADAAVESVLTIGSRGTTGSSTSKNPFTYGQHMRTAFATVRTLRIHACPRWPRALPKSFWLHRLANLTPHLTALVLRDYTGELATHLARMLTSRGGGLMPCPALAAVTYSTLAQVCSIHDVDVDGHSVPVPVPAPAPLRIRTRHPKAAATLDTILAATAARARALRRPLPRLVFCCPAVGRGYVLAHSCGVERIEVRGTDAWAQDAPSVEARYACSVPVQLPVPVPAPARARNRNRDGPGLGQSAHCGLAPGARAQCQDAQWTPEEEYDALWSAAARTATESEEGLGRRRQGGTACNSASTLLQSLIADTPQAQGAVDTGTSTARESFSSSEPQSESTSAPRRHGPANRNPRCPATGPEVDFASGEGAAADSDRSVAPVLAYFGLVCYLLSLWFVQLLKG